jgi:hypothetical protein
VVADVAQVGGIGEEDGRDAVAPEGDMVAAREVAHGRHGQWQEPADERQLQRVAHREDGLRSRRAGDRRADGAHQG